MATLEKTEVKYPLAVSTWDERELDAIRDVCASGRFTMGARVRQFEGEFANYFGSRFAVMVNSGSSANLLAVASQFYNQKKTLRPGAEVIVPALSWSTTYYPLHQYGLKLRFVDIDLNTLNIDVNAVANAITPQTRGVVAVNLLGTPCDFASLERICAQHDLCLLEDNCESMGAKVQEKHAGTFGVCGTFSTFFSHHICTMEGGVVVTDDEELYHILLSLRAHGWMRELPDDNLVFPKSGNAFDDLYRFVLPGYNLRPLEISGAIGSCQLRKLPDLLAGRRRNAAYFQRTFRNNPNVIMQQPAGESSWFAFSIILSAKLRGHRAAVVARLQEAGVECRPIVVGNFVKNPVVQYFDYSVSGPLTNVENVDVNGFYLGNHHIDLADQIDRVADVIEETTARV